MVKRISYFVLSLLILISLVYYYVIVSGEEDDMTVVRSSKRIRAPLKIKAVVAHKGTLYDWLTCTADLEAVHKTRIRAEVKAKVRAILVADGQQVKAGDTLVVLDGELYKADLARAKGDFFRALMEFLTELKLSLPGDTLKWARFLKNAYSQNQCPPLPEPQTLAETSTLARHGLPGYYATLKHQEDLLRKCTISAPFAGVVSALKVYPDQEVKPGDILMRLTDLSSLKIRIHVPEDELMAIKPGTLFYLLPFPEDTLKINAVLPEINSTSRQATAISVINNHDNNFKDGQRLLARVARYVYPDRLVIPRRAVLIRNNRPLVFAIHGGRAEWQYVELGAGNEDLIEIRAGVAPGDTVAVEGHYSLAHDTPVKVSVTPF